MSHATTPTAEYATPAPAVPSTPMRSEDIPEDVWRFAEANGVAAYLPAVAAMTRRVYAPYPVSIVLEEDLIHKGEWVILFEVDVTGSTSEQVSVTRGKWSAEIFHHCPAPLVHFFGRLLRERP